jgi:hypothetical protein
MAKSQEETRRHGEAAMNALFDPATAVNNFEPLLQAGNKWFEALMALNSEILEFSKARLDRSVEMGKAFARASTIEQAVDLQADYTRTMMRDYIDEAGKLADIGTRSMLESLTTLQAVARSDAPARDR